MIRPEFESAIAKQLTATSRVLDVGGAREPSRLATHMLDIVSREEARVLWGQDLPDHAPPAERWFVHDICNSDPFPFPDKFFDFVFCSHTLEDVRDPVRVCGELSRVSKAGYVETPSPLIELTRGMDPAGRGWIGYAHHRWLVDVQEGELVFFFKPHFLRASRRFHFPPRYAKRWNREGRAYTSLLWTGELRAREKVVPVRAGMEVEIERLVSGAIGDTLPMQWARARRQMFDLGVAVTEWFGIRSALRPMVGQIQRWR